MTTAPSRESDAPRVAGPGPVESIFPAGLLPTAAKVAGILAATAYATWHETKDESNPTTAILCGATGALLAAMQVYCYRSQRVNQENTL